MDRSDLLSNTKLPLLFLEPSSGLSKMDIDHPELRQKLQELDQELEVCIAVLIRSGVGTLSSVRSVPGPMSLELL